MSSQSTVHYHYHYLPAQVHHGLRQAANCCKVDHWEAPRGEGVAGPVQRQVDGQEYADDEEVLLVH